MTKQWTKLLLLFTLLILIGPLGGCIRLTGIRNVPTFPYRESEVVDVDGITIELKDGSRYRLLGIKKISGSAKNYLLQDNVMLDIQGDSAIVMFSYGHTFFPGPNGCHTLDGNNDIILFPTIRLVPPPGYDVAEKWLLSGEAQADLTVISNEGLRVKYKAAEAYAKQNKQGMWSKEK